MKKIIYLLLLLLLTIQMRADWQDEMKLVLPKDLPTIEALISMHKAIKKAEDGALAKVGGSYAIQTETTSNTLSWNEARNTLNTKLKNANSYLIFLSAITSCTTDLFDLINSYADLTKLAATQVFKRPMAAWYFTEANFKLAKEVKATEKLVLTLTASGFNLMCSTMSEKCKLLWQIESHIDNMKHIISKTYIWCKYLVSGGFKLCQIEKIITSDVTKDIAKGVINSWKKG